MIKRIGQALLLVSAALVAVPTLGQSDRVVKVATNASPNQVKRGSRFQLTATLDIQGGYHINSSRPAEAYLIATSLKLDPVAGLTLAAVRYPRALVKKFNFSKKPLSVYEGKVVLTAAGAASARAPLGRQVIRGKLRVQACNDEACLAPKTIEIEFPLEVVGG